MCGAATRMDLGLGGENQGAAPSTAPGHQVKWGGVDTPAAPHPTHHRGATVWRNPFPSLNTMPKLFSAMSIPAYARSNCSEGGVAKALLDDDED